VVRKNWKGMNFPLKKKVKKINCTRNKGRREEMQRALQEKKKFPNTFRGGKKRKKGSSFSLKTPTNGTK